MISLEQQVVSLKLAKRLKELGVRQENLFVWAEDPRDIAVYLASAKGLHGDRWSAFTVAELGEMLPVGFNGYKGRKGDYSIGFANFKAHSGTVHGDTEADARAKALIYLVENKLVTL